MSRSGSSTHAVGTKVYDYSPAVYRDVELIVFGVLYDLKTKSTAPYSSPNDTIEVTLGGETINVQIGNLANNFSNQKDKNVALQIIKDINDSVDNPAVINHFNNLFNKNFGVDEDDFDMSSFFEYEKKFKKNPLSI